MTEYLTYKRVNNVWTWVCKMSDRPCRVVPPVKPEELGEMGWEGCACACDKPMDKALEDRYEMMASRDVSDFY